MSQATINPYLKTKVMTASPEELRLMLYEGAVKFLRQAAEAMQSRDYEGSYNGLVRAQNIVLELSSSLNHDLDPDLCGKLSGLYAFIYRRLVDANMNRDTKAIREAIDLIEYERETWTLLMRQKGQSAEATEAAAVAAQAAAAQVGKPTATSPPAPVRQAQPGPEARDAIRAGMKRLSAFAAPNQAASTPGRLSISG